MLARFTATMQHTAKLMASPASLSGRQFVGNAAILRSKPAMTALQQREFRGSQTVYMGRRSAKIATRKGKADAQASGTRGGVWGVAQEPHMSTCGRGGAVPSLTCLLPSCPAAEGQAVRQAG